MAFALVSATPGKNKVTLTWSPAIVTGDDDFDGYMPRMNGNDLLPEPVSDDDPNGVLTFVVTPQVIEAAIGSDGISHRAFFTARSFTVHAYAGAGADEEGGIDEESNAIVSAALDGRPNITSMVQDGNTLTLTWVAADWTPDYGPTDPQIFTVVYTDDPNAFTAFDNETFTIVANNFSPDGEDENVLTVDLALDEIGFPDPESTYYFAVIATDFNDNTRQVGSDANNPLAEFVPEVTPSLSIVSGDPMERGQAGQTVVVQLDDWEPATTWEDFSLTEGVITGGSNGVGGQFTLTITAPIHLNGTDIYHDPSQATASVGTEDTIAPSSPTGLEIMVQTRTFPRLSWTPIEDATSYRIYKDESQVGEIDGSENEWQDPEGVAFGETVTYDVSAFDASGNESTAGTIEYTSEESVPALDAGDVRKDVPLGNDGDGTLWLPTEAQVEDGVGFGENGTEFEGELASGGGGEEPVVTSKGSFAR